MIVSNPTESELLLVPPVSIYQTGFNTAFTSTASIKTTIYGEIVNRRSSLSFEEQINRKIGVIPQVDYSKSFLTKLSVDTYKFGRMFFPISKLLLDGPEFFEIFSTTMFQIINLRKSISSKKIEFRNFKEQFSNLFVKIKKNLGEVEKIDQLYSELLNEIFNDAKLKSIIEELSEDEKMRRLEVMISLRILQDEYSSLSTEEQSEFKKEALRGTHFGKISP